MTPHTLLSTIFLLPLILGRIITVPPSPSSTRSTADYTYASDGGLDAPKIHPVDNQSYDWWYFDAVQSTTDGQFSSVSIVFYTSTFTGFDILGPSVPISNPSVNLIQITVSFPNGTIYDVFLNETQATFITTGDGITSYYNDNNAFFNVALNLKSASLGIEAKSAGFEGVLHLDSLAPAHGPCAAASPNANLELMPHIGWVNAIPDSKAYAAIKVFGEDLVINGNGYHDKNWGDSPFSHNLDSWYWGHARFGCYSIVFFDTLDRSQKEGVSVYLAKNDEIIVSQCSGLTVRPFGDGASYPPKVQDPEPKGLSLVMDTPEGMINATLTVAQTILGKYPSPYYRWAGSIEGTIGGQEMESGVAFFEQFAFAT